MHLGIEYIDNDYFNNTSTHYNNTAMLPSMQLEVALKLFPFNGTWWFMSNIINNSVYCPFNLISDTIADFL